MDDKGSVLQRLEPIICEVRNRKSSVEQSWLIRHAAWMGIRYPGRYFYNSKNFQHYIPAARRAIERTVVRAAQMMVPDNDFFEVYPGDDFDVMNGQNAESVTNYMSYLFNARIHIKRLVRELTRCFLIYDRAITKSSVELSQYSEDPDGKLMRQEIWPSLRAVDPFSFFVFPETVTDVEKAHLIFEDAMYSLADYRDAVKYSQGMVADIDEKDLDKPAWPTHHTERLALNTIIDPTAMPEGGNPYKPVPDNVERFVALTEGFLKADGWVQFWIVWNLKGGPKMVRLNKFHCPTQPYRMALARPIPGEHYTTGMMSDIEPLQVLFNDQINQMEEGRAIASVPPIAVDPGRVSRADSLEFGPRRKWLVDPDGVKVLPIPDTSRTSLSAAQMTLGLLNSNFSPGGFSEGQPPRNSPRAGFAVSSLMNLSMADIKEIADIMEDEILTPALHDLYKLTIMFVPSSQVLRIPGTSNYRPTRMTTQDLYGGWNFRWVGQLASQDLQVRSQRMLQLLGPLQSMFPIMAQQGWQLDLGQLFKMIWRDAMGERGIERLLVKVPPAPPMPPQGQPPQGGVRGPPPNAGGSPEAVERQTSRMMAGLAGGSSGNS